MAIQYCKPNADGYYTAWTNNYTAWIPPGSPPSTSYPPSAITLASGSANYESCQLDARVTPRVSVDGLHLYGWAFKDDTLWNLTYGTCLGASWSQNAAVNIDTFSPNLYMNLSITNPGDSTLDNSTYGILVYSNGGGTAYVAGAYLQMTYTPAGGGFMLILSTALASIGANLLLREMPALAAHTWRASGFQHWIEPQDYEPAWRALRELNVRRVYA